MIKKAYRWLGLVCMLLAFSLSGAEDRGFIRVKGHDLVDEQGTKFFIRGTNLGHWLNPEGYMFKFGKCNSPHFIDEYVVGFVGIGDVPILSFLREGVSIQPIQQLHVTANAPESELGSMEMEVDKAGDDDIAAVVFQRQALIFGR